MDPIEELRKEVRALTRACRQMAEALAAGDAADAVRVEGLMREVGELRTRIEALQPAADFFRGRAQAEGENDAAGKRLNAAVASSLARAIESVWGQRAIGALVTAAIAALAGYFGLATGAAGKAQSVFDTDPQPQEVQDAP